MKRARRGRPARFWLVVAALALCLLSLGGCLAVSLGGQHAARNVVLPRLAKRLDARLDWGDVSSSLGSLAIHDLRVRFEDIPEAEIDVPALEVSYRLWPLLLGRVEIRRVAAVSPSVRFAKIDASTISRAKSLAQRLAARRHDPGGSAVGATSPELAVVDGVLDVRDVAGAHLVVEGIDVTVADQGRFEVTADATVISTAEDGREIARLGSATLAGIRDPVTGIDIDEASIEGAQARWVVGDGTNDLSRVASDLRALALGDASAAEAGAGSGEPSGGLTGSELARVQLPPSIRVSRSQAEIVVSVGDRGDRTLRLADVQGQLYFGTDEEPPSVELVGRLEPGQGRFEIDASLDDEGLPSARAQLTALHLGALASGLSISGFTLDESSLVDADVTVARAADGAIRFRGELSTAGVTVQGRLVAAEPVTNLRVRAVASGEYRRDEGELSLDDARIFLNDDIETRLSGHFTRHAGRTVVDATADLSPIRCADLFEATPTALRDRLTGMMLTGLISGRAHFALDTEHVQDLELDVVFQNGCIATGTGQLSAERLAGSFLHRVQLPGEEIYEFQTGPGSGSWASMEQISPFMFAAVLSTEDGAFYHHSGYNLREIRTALIRDIEAGQPRFGASTITMQLARNLYLNRERTFARKIQEAVLTWYLESTLSKDEILTYYLNVIEFGPRIFGIRHAAMYYFGRQPDDLSPREAVFLAKLLPNPVQRHDSTFVEGELSPRWQTMLDRVLAVMRERRFITPAEYQAAVAERVVFFREGDPLPLHRTWRSRASSFDSWAEGEVDAPIDRWLEVDAEAEIPAPSELDDDFGDE